MDQIRSNLTIISENYILKQNQIAMDGEQFPLNFLLLLDFAICFLSSLKKLKVLLLVWRIHMEVCAFWLN